MLEKHTAQVLPIAEKLFKVLSSLKLIKSNKATSNPLKSYA